MMSEQEPEPLVTECPHCDTRFRVTENQLALANGRVRCGACLSVFVGAEYLQLESEIETSEEADRTLDEVLSELDDNELSDSTPADEAAENVTPEVADEAAIEDADEEANEDACVEKDETKESPQEEVAADGDPEELIQDTQEFKLFTSLSEPTEPIAKLNDIKRDFEKTRDGTIAATINEPANSQTIEAQAPVPGLPPFVIVESAEDVDARDNESKSAPDPNSLEALLPHLQFAEKPRSPWLPLIFMVGVLAITAQVFYYQFDTWGKNQAIRPIYALMCKVVGCELPVVRSLVDIRSRTSSVRPHATRAGVFSVEALIVNEAEFAQPFPTLEVRFTTIHGVLVTSYQVKPDDYLDGELAGVANMSPLQPIRIAFEVADPGSDAENYVISFL